MPKFVIGELNTFRSNAVNLNQTGDVASITGLPSSIMVDRMEILNWSSTPAALLAMTVRDAATGGGNSLLGSIVGLNTPVTATALAAVATPLAAVLGAVRVVSTGSLYLNVSVANGSALTADVIIYYRQV